MDTLTSNYTLLHAPFNRTLGYTDLVTISGFVDLDHTADWAIRAQGEDLADLFGQAAAGLLSLANPLPRLKSPTSRRTIRLHAPDREALLVRWLEELHFLLEVRAEVPRWIRIAISPDLTLVADLEIGPAANTGRTIKAVTFHGLKVAETARGLEATIVFDV